MTTTAQQERPILTLVSFGKSTDNGLWSALASKVNGSAAGSRLVGLRPGQPISAHADGMFDYGPEHMAPLWDPDSPAAA